MSITLEDPVETPRPSPSRPVRFATVRANLMPEEIINARRADVLRRRVLLAIVVLVLLLVSAYGASWSQTRSANGDLSSAKQRGASLQLETQQFAPVVSAQATTTSIKSELQSLMAGDLSWKTLLTKLRTQAPRGVQLTQISGNVTAVTSTPGLSGSNAGTYQALSPSTAQVVGTLTLAGNAPDQRSVANYSDALSATKGLNTAFVTSVTSAGSSTTFNITVSITADALGGRYVPATSAATAPTPAPATGGN